MSLPRILRRLFENEGAGPRLLKAILPFHADTHGAKGSDPITPESIGAMAANAKPGSASSADVAVKLRTPRSIDGMGFDGTKNIIHYAVCSTAAATAAKTVNLTGFVLEIGARILVRFDTTNTAVGPTLNVNGTGAKAIRYKSRQPINLFIYLLLNYYWSFQPKPPETFNSIPNPYLRTSGSNIYPSFIV